MCTNAIMETNAVFASLLPVVVSPSAPHSFPQKYFPPPALTKKDQRLNRTQRDDKQKIDTVLWSFCLCETRLLWGFSRSTFEISIAGVRKCFECYRKSSQENRGVSNYLAVFFLSLAGQDASSYANEIWTSCSINIYHKSARWYQTDRDFVSNLCIKYSLSLNLTKSASLNNNFVVEKCLIEVIFVPEFITTHIRLNHLHSSNQVSFYAKANI